MKYSKWLLVVLLVAPVSAFALYKPVRVLLPESFGVSCYKHNVCVEHPAQLDTAVALLNNSKQLLKSQWGLSVSDPKTIFCSTEKCQHIFGLSQRAGFTFGSVGIVIAPRGWKSHYVAHELIHYWQADNFGTIARLFGEPWLVEGMAYALSNDPRKELHEPFEFYRYRFNEWYRLNAGMPLKQSVGKVL